MSDPTFEHTAAALRVYDALAARLATEWDFAVTEAKVAELVKLEADMVRSVQHAFYADTHDRNRLANCMYVDIAWLRKLVAEHCNPCAEVSHGV